jgi:hypothetical protein
MHHGMLPKSALVIASVAYAIISTLCFFAGTVPALTRTFQANWGLLWLLGPPATLIYRLNYSVPYLLGTGLLVVIAFGFLYSSRRRSAVVWFFVALATVTWVAFGLLAYAPTI